MKYSEMSVEQKKEYGKRVQKYQKNNPEKAKKWRDKYRHTEKYRKQARERARKNYKEKHEHILNISLKSSRKNLPIPTRPCPNKCELCGNPPDRRVLALDHDHKTNTFRGWLCQKCNVALGKFGDDIAGLEQAVLYLRRNQAKMLPEDSSERKKIPISSGVLDYFPAALIEVAKVSYAGNQQHNPGEHLHWSRGKSMDHADTLQRHFIERGTLDIDGLRHSAKLAWRALALLQIELEEAGAPIARGSK